LDETYCNERQPLDTNSMNMDHDQARASGAPERYLLGEMSEPDRFAFEEHYFQCQECADEVRIGAALARGVQSVGREDAAARLRPKVIRAETGGSRRLRWLSPAALAPMAAAAMLACVVGYQSLVVIPRLQDTEAFEPLVLRAAARGDEQTIDLSSREPAYMIQIDVNAAEPGTPLVYEVGPEGGEVKMKGTAKAPPPGLPLLVRLPKSKLDRAGGWNLILRTASGSEIARYPFQLKLQ
jgi:Putative zinc-finger